ncbi:MAG: pyridoxal phosphate-dependent decarboxylase family protein [Phycisphaerales bacterium JB043]
MSIEQWKQTAQRVIELIASSVEASSKGDTHVVPWIDPEECARLWGERLASGDHELTDLLDEMIRWSTKLHNPGYIGHQVNPPDLHASLTQLVVACLNCSSAAYEMSPAGTMIERSVVRWMCDKIGFPSRAGGIFCSGGSLGNLTAMLAMRQHKAGYDAWNNGAHGHEPLCVLVSDESHYSISRAVRIMGWGDGGIEPIAIDAQRRIDPADLAPALERARSRGRRVIGVIASSCTTPTGAFDPIEPMAELCDRHDLWLHVDGAHGASLLLSEKHRHALDGIERADSIVWDAHKLMGVSMLSTGVLYRDESLAQGAFAQDAAYIFSSDAEEEWYNPAHRTLECTKGSLAAPFFMHLATRGEAYLGEHVDTLMASTCELADVVRASSSFELLNEPQCNIVCFAWRDAPDDISDANEFHLALRQALIREGGFYITQASLDGRMCLRCTVMNPATSRAEFEELLSSLERNAQVLLAAT